MLDLTGTADMDDPQSPSATHHYAGEKEIRAVARTMLATIDATPDISVDELCARLSTRRNRPVEVISRRFPCSTLLGFWVKTKAADLILHPDDLTATQRDHGIRHEIGHILLDHTGQASTQQLEIIRTLLPTLDPEDVVTYLPRTGNYVGVEWEAETFAHILTAAALRHPQQEPIGYFEAGLSSGQRDI